MISIGPLFIGWEWLACCVRYSLYAMWAHADVCLAAFDMIFEAIWVHVSYIACV